MSSLRRSDFVPKVVFFVSLVLGAMAVGYLIHRHGWWPQRHIAQAEEAYRELRRRLSGERDWYYFRTEATERTRTFQPEALQPGPTLVTYVGEDNHQFIEVIDADGAVLNAWRVDWFDLWPDADHLAEEFRPKELPGAIVHGVLLMDDGGVLLQHDACGLVRLDACGHVLWRLAERTHHSLHLDERGHIWTSIRHTRKEKDPALPVYHPPFEDYTIAEISPDGELLREVSIFDLLLENNLAALLHLASWHDDTPNTGGDTLHVNDVEVFPADLAPGRFRPGDVMVSMRRTNSLVVFDLEARLVRHVFLGGFVRQHDPDFIDGETISIFDNNHVGRREQGVQSRVVVQQVGASGSRIVFTGTPERPFFTDIMGRHQWLPNGNLLLVESTRGRVLEVTPEGEPVWEFVNVLADGWAGAVSEGTRLPEQMTPAFFAERRDACARPLSEAAGRAR